MTLPLRPRLLVGFDLVRICRIGESVRSFGDRFLRRIFTDAELTYCMTDAGASESRLAARFAAKEAARKVLCWNDDAVGWRTIEVVRDEAGWCEIALHEGARDVAARYGICSMSLSMTHESEYAGAVVVCERNIGSA